MCPTLQLGSQVTVATFAFENLNSKYLILGGDMWNLTYMQNNNDDKCISFQLLEICRHWEHPFSHVSESNIVVWKRQSYCLVGDHQKGGGNVNEEVTVIRILAISVHAFSALLVMFYFKYCSGFSFTHSFCSLCSRCSLCFWPSSGLSCK